MPEQDTTTDAAAESTGDSAEAATTEAATAEQQSTEGETALGDAGKKALDAMKAKWKEADKTAKEQAAENAALKAKLDGKEAEHQAQAEAQRVQDEAFSKANERILKAEIRAAAAGKLTHLDDAFRYPEHLDLSAFEVGADGEVDSSAIAQAIDDLIAARPNLAAQSGGRFQGSADAGARNDASKVSQLSRADMASMSPEQIDAAHEKGQFDNLMAGK